MLAASYQAIKRNDHQYGPEFRAKSISINVKINSNEQGKSEGFKGESLCVAAPPFSCGQLGGHTHAPHTLLPMLLLARKACGINSMQTRS